MLDSLKISRISESDREDERAILVDHSHSEFEGVAILGEPGLMAEEVESTLTQLAECITASDAQITETVNEHLDKIIETIAKFEVPDRENIDTEAMVQEELEELFTELFNLVGITYTPETINYLARQTLIWHLGDEIEKLKGEEETEEEVQPDSGTPAIVKKLIAALRMVKRAAERHVYAIGRVALVLCNFNLQLTPRV